MGVSIHTLLQQQVDDVPDCAVAVQLVREHRTGLCCPPGQQQEQQQQQQRQLLVANLYRCH